jgi:hypothetical protein
MLTLLTGVGILWAFVYLFIMGPRLEQVKGFSKRFGGPRRTQPRQADNTDQKAAVSSNTTAAQEEVRPMVFGSFIPASMAPLRVRRKGTAANTTSSKPTKNSSSVQLPPKYTSNSATSAYAEPPPPDWNVAGNAGESSDNPIDLCVGPGSKSNPVDLTGSQNDGQPPESMPLAAPKHLPEPFKYTSQSISQHLPAGPLHNFPPSMTSQGPGQTAADPWDLTSFYDTQQLTVWHPKPVPYIQQPKTLGSKPPAATQPPKIWGPKQIVLGSSSKSQNGPSGAGALFPLNDDWASSFPGPSLQSASTISQDSAFQLMQDEWHLNGQQTMDQLRADEQYARELAEEEEFLDWGGPMQVDGATTSNGPSLLEPPHLGSHSTNNYDEPWPAGYSNPAADTDMDMDIDHKASGADPSTAPASVAGPLIEVSNEDEENEADIPEEERVNLDQLKQYVEVLSIPCAGCHRKIAVRQEDIPGMTQRWVSSTGKIVCGLPCSGSSFCSVTTCPGCRKAIKTDFHSESAFGSPLATTVSNSPSTTIRVGGMEFFVHYCCDGGREFALWALACGWDPVPTKSLRETVISKLRPRLQNTTLSAQGGSIQKHASNHLSGPRDRLTRNRATAKGTGYGGTENHYLPQAFNHLRRSHKPHHPVITPKAPDAKEDLAHEAYFRLVSRLLPSLDTPNPGNMDLVPPIHLHTMLARSPLMVRAADMLNNDSISDISRQHTRK